MGKRKALSPIPYNIFIQQSWEKNGKQGDYNEFVKTCEVKWREMTDTEKEEYNVNKNANKLENDASSEKKIKKAKKEKDPNKPKRPKSSYLLFCDAFRDTIKKSNPKLSMLEVTKELSIKWNALESSEKQKYIDMADLEKKKYQELVNGDEKKGGEK